MPIKNQSLKNWQGTIAVIGVDFGDSGKGRLIDDLASSAHVVARFSGGANTGHTVINKFGKFAFHIIPSGIFNPKALCLVGRGVAVSCESLFLEMEALKKAGVTYKNLIIDQNAQLTMPWHILRDGLREKLRKSKIGTTNSGVGPTYADRTERVGLRVKDLISKDFKEKLFEEMNVQNKFYNLKLKSEDIFKKYKAFVKLIKPHVGNTIDIAKNAQKQSKNILFEGAQGFFLDIDSGTYPFVTSSNPGVVGIWRSYAFHPSEINMVVGITKSYITRVGEGPLPTQVASPVKNHLVKKGHEFGTTTGRERRPGWLDLVLVKAARDDNKLTNIALTKLDVLSGLNDIKICTSYKRSNRSIQYQSGDAAYLDNLQPIYESLPGWSQDISDVRAFQNLPTNAKKFVAKIEEYLKLPVSFISVGAQRGQVIYR